MTVRTSTGSSVALVFTGLILVAANLRAALTSVGPVVPALSQDLGLTSFAASALISLPLFAFAVVSLWLRGSPSDSDWSEPWRWAYSCSPLA